jgi:hypothetical protein
MTTPRDRVSHLDLMARLESAFTDLPDAPSPDLIDHERFTAYVKTPHDVGGEPDAPIKFENKQYEAWEENTTSYARFSGGAESGTRRNVAASGMSTSDARSI